MKTMHFEGKLNLIQEAELTQILFESKLVIVKSNFAIHILVNTKYYYNLFHLTFDNEYRKDLKSVTIAAKDKTGPIGLIASCVGLVIGSSECGSVTLYTY